MLKKLTLALTLTAATASAEVTVEDQKNVNLIMDIVGVGEYCGFDLTAGANAMSVDLIAYVESRYSETALFVAGAVAVGILNEQLYAAASDEAWCAEKLSLDSSYWIEPN